MPSRGHLESSLPPGLLRSYKTALRKEPSFEIKQSRLFTFGPHCGVPALSKDQASFPIPELPGHLDREQAGKASWLGPAQPSVNDEPATGDKRLQAEHLPSSPALISLLSSFGRLMPSEASDSHH